MWANSTKDDEIFYFYFRWFLHVNKILRHQINWNIKILSSAKEWCNFNIFPLNYNKVTISQREAVFFPLILIYVFLHIQSLISRTSFNEILKYLLSLNNLNSKVCTTSLGQYCKYFWDILEVVKSIKNQ